MDGASQGKAQIRPVDVTGRDTYRHKVFMREVDSENEEEKADAKIDGRKKEA